MIWNLLRMLLMSYESAENQADNHSTWNSNTTSIPCSDVVRRYNSFSWSSEEACQIESFISTSLHIVTKLDYHNIGHCVGVLKINNQSEISQYFLFQSETMKNLPAVCHILDILELRWFLKRLLYLHYL